MAKAKRQFVGFDAQPEHLKWLEIGARVLGSKAAVIRAVLDEAMAQGMTFGARTVADARKAGGA
jgi:hypothetical protein